MSKRALHALLLGLVTLVAGGAIAAEATTDAGRVEETVRQYFRHMQAYDFEAMRAAATPQLEILDNGHRRDHAAFVTLLRNERQAKGVKYQFQLSKFDTVVTPEVAYTTFVTHQVFSGPLAEGSGDYLNSMILRRFGNRWLVDRLFHMPLKPEREPKK